MKPTKTMNWVLSLMSSGDILMHSKLTGNVWMKKTYVTILVKERTFNALLKRGLIILESQNESTEFYKPVSQTQ